MGLHKLKTGSTVNLAEQQLVDCSTQNNGCSGGRPDWALTYLNGKSIYTTASYPYTARDGSCKSGTASGVTVTGYSRVSKSDSALASALGTSAITVLVYADSAFQSYRSGVLTAPTTCNLNHAVLATGYGSNFWKIKNSWGSSWGESGYIRFSRTSAGCGSYGMFYDYPTTAKGVNAVDLTGDDVCPGLGKKCDTIGADGLACCGAEHGAGFAFCQTDPDYLCCSGKSYAISCSSKAGCSVTDAGIPTCQKSSVEV